MGLVCERSTLRLQDSQMIKTGIDLLKHFARLAGFAMQWQLGTHNLDDPEWSGATSRKDALGGVLYRRFGIKLFCDGKSDGIEFPM